MFDKKYVLYAGLIIILFTCCKKKESPVSTNNDVALVTYEGQELHYADITEHVAEEIHDRDSQQVVGNYIEKWIKEKIMIHEAKEQVSDKKEIDRLTEDFRNDLLLLKYEEQLIKQKLDTVISDEELLDYYKSNKSRYKLESTIFRFIFIKANKPLADAKNFETIWKNLNSRNLQMLNLYCQNNADICFLNPERWYKWEEIKQYIPAKFLNENNIHAGVNRDFADFEFVYRLNFFEVVRPNEEPPLSFLRDQATQAILHQRKISLLDKIKSDLYERELKSKKIIFTNK
jgi:hypothetical protein